MFFQVNPVILEGEGLRLEPLSQEHAQGLFNRGQYAADWDYMARACFIDMADTRQWIDEALNTPNQLAFAIVETGKGKAVGSTRYMNIREEHKSLEIGWTWLGQEWQRTSINTEAKLLLLSHAFERVGCLRVEFKTDERNLRSQRALERIGATREGVLRKHMIVQKDFPRNSVYFSVIDNEWPEVKNRLLQLRER
ncbi:MAG: GNAT family N-acetyltransferase [Proteobacteria bacterium]|nr:GNAT family N-acetyltransferase [Pseudomonadota bacterium]